MSTSPRTIEGRLFAPIAVLICLTLCCTAWGGIFQRESKPSQTELERDEPGLGAFNEMGELWTCGMPRQSPEFEFTHAGGTFRIWNPATGDLLSTSSAPSLDETAISPDGRIIAVWDNGMCEACSYSPDGKVRLYDTANMKLLGTMKSPVRGISCIAFSPDSRTLVVSFRDDDNRFDRNGDNAPETDWKNLRGFDVSSCKELYALSAPPDTEGGCRVTALPRLSAFAVQNLSGGVIEVRDFRTGRMVRAVPDDRPEELARIPENTSFSPDKQMWLLATESSFVLCRADDDSFLGDEIPADGVRLPSPALWVGPQNLVAAQNGDTIAIYNGTDGSPIKRYTAPAAVVLFAASRVSPWLALKGKDGLFVLNVETGKARQLLAGLPEEPPRFMSPRKSLKMVLTNALKPKRRTEPQKPVPYEHAMSWTFLADGRLWVRSEMTADGHEWSKDQRISTWDPGTGECLQSAKSPVVDKKLTISPDGRCLASFDNGGKWKDHGTVCIWDAESGTLKTTLRDYPGYIRDAVFASDSKSLVISGRRAPVSDLWRDRKRFIPESLKNLRAYSVPDGTLLWARRTSDGACPVTLPNNLLQIRQSGQGPPQREFRNLRTGEVFLTGAEADEITTSALHFSPETGKAAWIDRKGKLQIAEFPKRRTLASSPVPEYSSLLGWSGDSKLVLSSPSITSNMPELSMVDARTGRQTPLGVQTPMAIRAFSPVAPLMAAQGEGGLRVLNLETQQWTPIFPGRPAQPKAK